MICPHCGAEHDEAKGRFCDACGMSVIPYVKRKDDDDERVKENAPIVRCRHCGTKAPPPICPACGNKMPDPDD
jgi:NMD protein affecting ribosome stability and mRNA decay